MKQKKLRNIAPFLELYNLCVERPNCRNCPMLFEPRSCKIPNLQENPSYIPTAIRLMENDKKHRELNSNYLLNVSLFND